jgi:hypothetical protein
MRLLESYGEAGTDADADRWYPSTLCRPNDADFAARAIKQSPGHG